MNGFTLARRPHSFNTRDLDVEVARLIALQVGLNDVSTVLSAKGNDNDDTYTLRATGTPEQHERFDAYREDLRVLRHKYTNNAN